MIALISVVIMIGLLLTAFLAWRSSGAVLFEKPPIWFRAASGVAAAVFFASTPLALILGACCLFGTGPGGGHSEPTSWDKALGGVHLLVPLFGLLSAWSALGMPGLPRRSPAGSVDEGYELLERATQLERKGRVQEVLDLYEEIAVKHSQTPAGQDAQASLRSLRAQL